MKLLVGCGPLPAFPLPVPRAYEFPLRPAWARPPALPERRLSPESTPRPGASAPPAIPTGSWASRLQPVATTILGVAPLGTGAASATASLGAATPHQATQLLAAGIQVHGSLVSRGTLADEWVAANLAYRRALANAAAAEHVRELDIERARQSNAAAQKAFDLAAEEDHDGAIDDARALRDLASKETARANVAGTNSRQHALISSIAKREAKVADSRRGELATDLSAGDPAQWAGAASSGSAGASKAASSGAVQQ